MSKRNTESLTKTDYRGIIKWLKNERICPFNPQNSCVVKCKGLFPKIDPEIDCPCHKYTMEYVTRVARKVLKEAGYEV